MLLVSPPEGVLLKDLVLLEILSDAPAFIVGKRKSVFLEKRVDARDATVPAVFKVIERQPTILCRCFFTLQSILSPDSL